MLAVISDLHFEEESSDAIPDINGDPALYFSRNTSPRAYSNLIGNLASEAERNGAERLDLILAGDVFDLHRTSLWFREPGVPARPYPTRERPHGEPFWTGSPLETKTLEILRAIAAEPEVSAALTTFRLLAEGRYAREANGELHEREFPVPATIHYLPGNHDRLANLTPAVRREVRSLLGVPGGENPLPHTFFSEDPCLLVRHGHEYDRYNFSADYSSREIPLILPEAEYAASAFGDLITIEVASRFPALFREIHGDAKILRSDMLSTLYLRLLEFDDLRPQSALLDFLLNVPGVKASKDQVWKMLTPVVEEILDEVHDHPFLRMQLEKYDRAWTPDAIDAVQAYLDLKGWRLGVPMQAARLYTSYAVAEETGTVPRDAAARETVIRDGEARFVIAGHTHSPQVALLTADRLGERYYVDTGTWRNRIPATPDYSGFGRLKTLTYAIFYATGEDRGDRGDGKLESFDYWAGFTRRFSESDPETP